VGRQVAPCRGPPYHVVVAPPVALRRELAPHHVASSASHIHPASSCLQWWSGVLSLSTLVGPLSLSSPVCTSLPPYEQLLVAEGSGAMGVVVSPLSPSSSCPGLAVLVLVPMALVLASLLLLSPPLPVPFLAHRRCGDGDRPVSTRSTLRARARSGGRWVLGCWSHPRRLCAPGILAKLHPRSTLRAVLVGLEAGAGSMFRVGGRRHLSVRGTERGVG
jgi:hypothetical protein